MSPAPPGSAQTTVNQTSVLDHLGQIVLGRARHDIQADDQDPVLAEHLYGRCIACDVRVSVDAQARYRHRRLHGFFCACVRIYPLSERGLDVDLETVIAVESRRVTTPFERVTGDLMARADRFRIADRSGQQPGELRGRDERADAARACAACCAWPGAQTRFQVPTSCSSTSANADSVSSSPSGTSMLLQPSLCVPPGFSVF